MNKKSLLELKERPLFSLTVDEFLSLQQGEKISKEEAVSLPRIIGVDEAVVITGYKKATLYRKTSDSTIPHFKRSGKILFLREELENWLLENRRETIGEQQSLLNSLWEKKSSITKKGKIHVRKKLQLFFDGWNPDRQNKMFQQ